MTDQTLPDANKVITAALSTPAVFVNRFIIVGFPGTVRITFTEEINDVAAYTRTSVIMGANDARELIKELEKFFEQTESLMLSEQQITTTRQ
jgi:hypothetical protein